MCVTACSLSIFLAWTEPGDQDWSWRSQFKWLEEHHMDQLVTLREDILIEGQKEPVQVGSDGRLWDGHHRVYCLVDLGMPEILLNAPCENCRRDN